MIQNSKLKTQNSSYTVGSLADLALGELVALLNRAYVGYPGPFSPEDPMSYAEFCRVQQIDLARSVLARDAAGAAIGFGLLGIRRERGWCAEFGVVPEWRRQGVGRALLRRLLATARASGLRDLRLEVASANGPAGQLYSGAGFKPARTLHNYAATATALGLPRVTPPPDVTVTIGEIGLLAADLGLPPDPHPAWDHEIAALLVASGTRTLLARHGDTPVGLLHYTLDLCDPEIRRLAVRDGDLSVARTLLAAATGNPEARLLVAYVDERSPLAPLLPALGFHELESDVEMICEL